jgi:heme-degrading monooxygenase HmoA
MPVVVVSQAWTLDEGAHADAYIQLAREFLSFMRQHPGFLGRKLTRGVEDRTHFTNLRFFDSVQSYEELIKFPGYGDHIMAMGAHLKPYDTYPREYMELVLDDIADCGLRIAD